LFLKTLQRIEEYLSDKVVVKEGRVRSLRTLRWKKMYFFARDGFRLFRLRRIAIEVIPGEEMDCLVIPRDMLKDLILIVEIERKIVEIEGGRKREDYVRFYWLDPMALPLSDLDIPREKSRQILLSELLGYKFECDEEDLIEVDLREISSLNHDSVLKLSGVLFKVKGEADKHDEICAFLADIGRIKGYEGKTEYKIVGGLMLDVVYLKEGSLEAAIEVVLAGSVKEALFKLGLVKAKAKFLVIKRERMEEAQKLLAPDIVVIEAEKVYEAKTSVGALASLLADIEKALSAPLP